MMDSRLNDLHDLISLNRLRSKAITSLLGLIESKRI